MPDQRRQHIVARLNEITMGEFRKVLQAEGAAVTTPQDEERTIQRWRNWRDNLLYARSLDRNYRPADLDHLADLLAREILTVQLAHMAQEVSDVIDFSHPHRQHARRVGRSGDGAYPTPFVAWRSAL